MARDVGAIMAERLVWARGEAGLTQRALAEAMQDRGVSVSDGATIARYELWDRYHRWPSGDYLRVLADLAQTSADYLVARTDDPRPVVRGEDGRRLDLVRAALDATPLEGAGDMVMRSSDGRTTLVQAKSDRDMDAIAQVLEHLSLALRGAQARPVSGAALEDVLADPGWDVTQPPSVARLHALLAAYDDDPDGVQLAFDEADRAARKRRQEGAMDHLEWQVWRSTCQGAVLGGAYQPEIDQDDPLGEGSAKKQA